MRAWVAIAALGSGCIIPDAGIELQEDFGNPGAVRIVQPTPITPEADRACGELDRHLICPTVSDTLPSGVLKSNGDLCICPARDDNAPNSFQIYVEDPDVDVENKGRPLDDIFGAFLLDVPPDATDLTAYLAYKSALPPDEPARLSTSEQRTIDRETPGLREFQVGGFSGATFDLCNDNDGAKLAPGVHELRFIATDRPWFSPAQLDGDGKVVLDDENNPRLGEPLIGVPDLPGGATYATTAYVFRCNLESAMPVGVTCGCFDPEEPG